MVTTAIDPEKPVSDDHQEVDDGHEEEILQAASETKKKVTNNDGYTNLKHHQRDSDQKEQVPDHEHG